MIPGLYDRIKLMMRYLWNSEVLPEGFVRGLTLMFHKGQGKDKEDPGSYRPVTCLLHIYKFFSTLVLHRLAGEVELFHVDTQGGFRQGRRVHASSPTSAHHLGKHEAKDMALGAPPSGA
jgi:hypothetical protein